MMRLSPPPCLSWEKVSQQKAYMLFYRKMPEPEIASNGAADSHECVTQEEAPPVDLIRSSTRGGLSADGAATAHHSMPSPDAPLDGLMKQPERPALNGGCHVEPSCAAADGTSSQSSPRAVPDPVHLASLLASATISSPQTTAPHPPTTPCPPPCGVGVASQPSGISPLASIAGTGMLADLVNGSISSGPSLSTLPEANAVRHLEPDESGESELATGGAEGEANGKPHEGGDTGLVCPRFTIQTIDAEASTSPFDTTYHELILYLDECESVKLPGFGGKVDNTRYTFRAPGKYLEVEVPWPVPVDAKRAQSKFIKSKRQLQVRVPVL